MPAIPWILGALGIGATGGAVAASSLGNIVKLAVIGAAIFYVMKKVK